MEKREFMTKEILEAETVFEENGIEYFEKDGLYYPKLILEEHVEAEDFKIGKWGSEWISYMEKSNKKRYCELVRTGQIRNVAHEIDLEAGEMLSELERDYYEKHMPKGNRFWQNYQVREQGRMVAEEIVRKEVIQVER